MLYDNAMVLLCMYALKHIRTANRGVLYYRYFERTMHRQLFQENKVRRVEKCLQIKTKHDLNL